MFAISPERSTTYLNFEIFAISKYILLNRQYLNDLNPTSFKSLHLGKKASDI